MLRSIRTQETCAWALLQNSRRNHRTRWKHIYSFTEFSSEYKMSVAFDKTIMYKFPLYKYVQSNLFIYIFLNKLVFCSLLVLLCLFALSCLFRWFILKWKPSKLKFKTKYIYFLYTVNILWKSLTIIIFNMKCS